MKLSMSVAGWKTMENIIEWEKQRHSHEDAVEAVMAAPSFTVPNKLPITVMSRGLPHNTLRQTKMSYADVDAYKGGGGDGTSTSRHNCVLFYSLKVGVWARFLVSGLVFFWACFLWARFQAE